MNFCIYQNAVEDLTDSGVLCTALSHSDDLTDRAVLCNAFSNPNAMVCRLPFYKESTRTFSLSDLRQSFWSMHFENVNHHIL